MTIARLKLPAYGAALLRRRRAGEDVLEVELIYGRDWHPLELGDAPRVALVPEEYAASRFDFHVLAGLRVTVHDQIYGAWEFEPPKKYGKFYLLLRELAECDAFVRVRWLQCTPELMDVDELAASCRYLDDALGGIRWPHWWSDELHARHRARAALWIADRGREIIEPERGRA